jgi:hypothetical protein
LADLCETPEQPELAHLLGIMLLRRRILQPDESLDAAEPDAESFVLVHPSTDARFSVPAVELDLEAIESLQVALRSIMYREG